MSWLTPALLVAGRDLRSWLGSAFGWSLLAALSFATGLLYYISFDRFASMAAVSVDPGFRAASLDVTQVFSLGFVPGLCVILLFFLPLMTMRTLAEEKKLGTAELLITAPISSWQIAVGKFLGGMGMLAVVLGLLGYVPVTLLLWADPDPAVIAAGYLALLLFGGFGVALGLACSALTENQILAGALSLVALLSLWLIGEGAAAVADDLGGVNAAVEGLLRGISLPARVGRMAEGAVDTGDALFFSSAIGVFLFIAQQRIEALRWR